MFVLRSVVPVWLILSFHAVPCDDGTGELCCEGRSRRMHDATAASCAGPRAHRAAIELPRHNALDRLETSISVGCDTVLLARPKVIPDVEPTENELSVLRVVPGT